MWLRTVNNDKTKEIFFFLFFASPPSHHKLITVVYNSARGWSACDLTLCRVKPTRRIIITRTRIVVRGGHWTGSPKTHRIIPLQCSGIPNKIYICSRKPTLFDTVWSHHERFGSAGWTLTAAYSDNDNVTARADLKPCLLARKDVTWWGQTTICWKSECGTSICNRVEKQLCFFVVAVRAHDL